MTQKTLVILAVALASTGLMTGCWQMPKGAEPEAAAPMQPPLMKQDHPVKRAAPELQPDSVVERVVILSERLQQSQEKVIGLQNESRKVNDENRRLLAQVATLQTELAQTQKELTDGNELLREMSDELAQWKKNVLGFRGEIRTAEQAQLEAITKVIELLGGVVDQPKTKVTAKEAATTNGKPKQPGA